MTKSNSALHSTPLMRDYLDGLIRAGEEMCGVLEAISAHHQISSKITDILTRKIAAWDAAKKAEQTLP